MAFFSIFSSIGMAQPSAQDIVEKLRAQMSAGIILSNATERLNLGSTATQGSSNQFSKANLYLSLELLPDVISEWKPFGTAATGTTAAVPGIVGFFIDPLINVRLTTVGVNVVPQTGVPLFDASKFLPSQKAAVIQLGGIAGITFKESGLLRWQLGYIERSVVQSITESEKASRFWDPDDDLYTAYTHGVRLTLAGKKSETWRPVFYIDVSKGTFENFEFPAAVTANGRACLNSLANCAVLGNTAADALKVLATDFKGQRFSRTYVESRLYLGGFHFGFEVNNGSGIDDMRFLFGGTFDLTKLFQ